MIALGMILCLGPWIKIEPFQPEYLDSLCEIKLTDQYSKLTGGRRYSTLSNESAKIILLKNQLSPQAWKLAVDVYLHNKSGENLLALVDSIGGKALSKSDHYNFLHCKAYAVNVIHQKFLFSSDYFGGKSWERILANYKTLSVNSGMSLENIFDSRDISLAELCLAVPSGMDGSREFALKAKNAFPNDYNFEFYYTFSLKVVTYSQNSSSGKLEPKMSADPQKYEGQLQLLRSKWPNEATPYYLSMNLYRTRDKARSQEFARKYISLEKRLFRVNWINQAKEILQ